MENQKKPMRVRVREMEVGDTISFDISKMPLLRGYSTTVGQIYRRKYTTKVSRKENRIYITRLS